MREIRSSGSVEGVVSNHDSYSDMPGEAYLPTARGASDADVLLCVSGPAQP
jgi:hypothetical protein